ncbi:hypothetical protein JB92DRAFT_2828377 [Gautieria morchelliformis]|nr:hypothetical protein JB92DRAFT_2828377 [Gautieria morchelliformis]
MSSLWPVGEGGKGLPWGGRAVRGVRGGRVESREQRVAFEILEEGSLILNWSLYQIVRQLPPQRIAGTATWCSGGEPGITQVAAERAGDPVTVQEGSISRVRSG